MTTTHPGPLATEHEWTAYAARVGRPLTTHEDACRRADVFYDRQERGAATGPMPEGWRPGQSTCATEGCVAPILRALDQHNREHNRQRAAAARRAAEGRGRR